LRQVDKRHAGCSRREMLRVTGGALMAAGLHGWVSGRSAFAAVPAPHWRLQAVDFSWVELHDGFWSPKQAKVATRTFAACIYQTEVNTGRIRNFEKAGARQGLHEGVYFDDSDVYKAIEAIAYSLRTHPDPQLEAKADEWIAKIVAAQLPDGYLNTYFTLTGLDKRWTDMEKHEDYCAGHLIEAAIAYYRATGKRSLLDAAIRLANHIDTTFRIPDRHWVSGHEEIELASMKLYHLTGDSRYLELAGWYLEQRGRGYGKGALWLPGTDLGYCQDAVPVKDQRKITGHAVRAMYLYSGAADVAAVTRDAGYMNAMTAVWEDVVERNMYVTGGIGSAGSNEGFTRPFDLPNKQAYCETCASVGMVFWNHRMNLLTGEAKYVDVMERSLYNGALDGLSLSGDRFFYANPLASDTSTPAGPFGEGRKAWFGTACCPSNISRLVCSLGGYLYGVSEDSVWVNLFISNSTRVKVAGKEVALQLDTRYPWEGAVRLTVQPETRSRFVVRMRIPGWAQNTPVPSDLYRFTDQISEPVVLEVNERPVRFTIDKGYAVLEREWSPGDTADLLLPMPVRRLRASNEVTADSGRVAFQRGPLVYCIEGTDNDGEVWNLVVPENATLTAHPHKVLDEEVVAVRCEGKALVSNPEGSQVGIRPQTLTAIPYYTWANRDNLQMQVWIPTEFRSLKVGAIRGQRFD
jgi:DUF1680 family protein